MNRLWVSGSSRVANARSASENADYADRQSALVDCLLCPTKQTGKGKRLVRPQNCFDTHWSLASLWAPTAKSAGMTSANDRIEGKLHEVKESVKEVARVEKVFEKLSKER